ncbi:sigma-70 family RNA polymerase sigma factor [Streptomyces sp. NPDC047002]|uniref:sigma-70 family RNA polymerase sigma factor n=1 Tax=Streptomyces sp. NPDC047002 TaxID=3155475 RepID=UPI0034537198
MLSSRERGQEAEAGMAGREDAFLRQAARFRPELLAHCYRMLGSVQDAEDLVQETYLRAWRGYAGFEGRSSLRYWLYRIATSACLTALEHHSRRFLPAGLGGPGDDPTAPLNPTNGEVAWVQPMPDPPSDPAAVVVSRGSVRLALIVALQALPPRQRAVLILRDVLAWRAAEVAELLDTSTAAVNSALQRARAQLQEVSATEDEVSGDRLDEQGRRLLDGYAKAFETADVDALLKLLHSDATLQMPPEPLWFTGRENIGAFFAQHVFPRSGPQRVLRTSANGGQPTMATYWRGADGMYHPHALQVLTLGGRGIVGIVAFRDASLFQSFGMPARLGSSPIPSPSCRG